MGSGGFAKSGVATALLAGRELGAKDADAQAAVGEQLLVLVHRIGTVEADVQGQEGEQGGGVRGLRQLPQAAVQALGHAPGQEQAAPALEPQGCVVEQGQVLGALARGHDRELVFAARGPGLAQVAHRAHQAGGARGRAHRGAQLHEALVEVARGLGRHQGAGQAPQLAGGGR